LRSPHQELVVSARSVKDEEAESSFGETSFKFWGDLRRKIKLWGDDFQALGRRKSLKRLINKGDLLSRLYRLF
jgi:hypothetical protein